MDTAQPADRTESRNDVVSLALLGELEDSTIPISESRLRPFEADRAAIVLDLRDLEFCGSNTAHPFCAAYAPARADDRDFVFVGDRPSARRVFKITETEYLLSDPVALLARSTAHEADGPALQSGDLDV